MSDRTLGVVLLIAAWTSGYLAGNGGVLAAVLVVAAAVALVILNALVLEILRRLARMGKRR